MTDKSLLAEFQDALMELFVSGKSHDAIMDALTTDPRFEPYRDYVKDFDPDMVDVACDLASKWAKRKD